jgi:hypothetical protein
MMMMMMMTMRMRMRMRIWKVERLFESVEKKEISSGRRASSTVGESNKCRPAG